MLCAWVHCENVLNDWLVTVDSAVLSGRNKRSVNITLVVGCTNIVRRTITLNIQHHLSLFSPDQNPFASRKGHECSGVGFLWYTVSELLPMNYVQCNLCKHSSIFTTGGKISIHRITHIVVIQTAAYFLIYSTLVSGSGLTLSTRNVQVNLLDLTHDLSISVFTFLAHWPEEIWYLCLSTHIKQVPGCYWATSDGCQSSNRHLITELAKIWSMGAFVNTTMWYFGAKI